MPKELWAVISVAASFLVGWIAKLHVDNRADRVAHAADIAALNKAHAEEVEKLHSRLLEMADKRRQDQIERDEAGKALTGLAEDVTSLMQVVEELRAATQRRGEDDHEVPTGRRRPR